MTHTSALRFTTALWLLIVIAGCIFATGCSRTKDIVYFRDIPDSTNYVGALSATQFEPDRIRRDDILNITVQTLDPKSQEIFAPATGGLNMNMPGAIIPGYLVDKDGQVELPLVGKIKVADLTFVEAKEAIRSAAQKYYKDPVVNVRLMNFRVTFQGEVGRPGTIFFNYERVGLIDGLGQAGDLTSYGRRDNVLLIREENGQKKFIRFNLNSSDVFKSPYYYLRSGDIIVVQPNIVKARMSTVDPNRDRFIGYGITAIGLIINIATFAIVNQNR
jgi:polysaccharide export outer membrane protein